MGQKIEARSPISAQWQSRLQERWVPVNADPWYPLMIHGDSSFRFRSVKGLPGYLASNKLFREMEPPSDERLDGLFFQAPDAVRDLVDAAIETRDTQEWLRSGSYLYRPLSGLARLPSGKSHLLLGVEGLAEWRQLPPSGHLVLSGASHWFLYDSDFSQLASGEGPGTPSFSGVGEKYLLLFGKPGDTLNLDLSTP